VVAVRSAEVRKLPSAGRDDMKWGGGVRSGGCVRALNSDMSFPTPAGVVQVIKNSLRDDYGQSGAGAELRLG
jgi:hypothetical protein